MQDLLHGFTDPNVMDIKMGTRTFLESEVTNLTARPDLYEKVSQKNEYLIVFLFFFFQFKPSLNVFSFTTFPVKFVKKNMISVITNYSVILDGESWTIGTNKRRERVKSSY